MIVLTAMTLAGETLAQSSDPLLNTLIKKGILSEDEARSIKAEADANQSNNVAIPESKWKISSAIKSVELVGDIRMRFESRQAQTPDGGKVGLDRGRYAVRLGLRGEAFDDFYYGVRLSLAANPRSPWVTFGTSTSGSPYQGPFGKSTAGVNIDQAYLGWRPEKWADFTIGKMSNPLYTTSMVWDTDLEPEGLAERFKYDVGPAQFFVTLAQFLYADDNPTTATGGLGFNGFTGQSTTPVFQIAWQAGLNYKFTSNIWGKVGATLYQYAGLQQSTLGTSTSPFFGDPFVGEGAFAGANSFSPVNGASGFGTSSTLPGNQSLGFANNQVGLNDLLVVEIPFELNFKISQLDARLFGDFSYNLDGKQRAEAAAAGYATYLASGISPATIKAFGPQDNDVKAYQIGAALGSRDNLGMVYGTVCKKHAWEVRTYWQHIEQYALDPNLIDSDFFEGRGNLEGFYAAAAYGFTDNVIGTIRYGHAGRINDKLGTGGSNQDIPQVNPIQTFDIFQTDLTFRF